MTKYEFLNKLRDRLSGLPTEDIERSVEYYAEIIDDRMEETDEATAVAAVGSVEEIATQILMETPLPKLAKAKLKPSRTLRAWEIVLLILGSPVWLPLIAAVIAIVLAVYLVIWSVVAVLYSVALSFGASAAAGILSSLAFVLGGNFAVALVFFGAGLLLAGFSIFMFFGSNQAARWLLILSKKILLGIKSLFIRKERA